MTLKVEKVAAWRFDGVLYDDRTKVRHAVLTKVIEEELRALGDPEPEKFSVVLAERFDPIHAKVESILGRD